MKKVLFLIPMLFFLCQCGQEMTEADLGEKTEISIKPMHSNKTAKLGNTYNAGEVVKGEKIRAQFEITNEGDIPLIINKIKPGCGCTNATEAPENPIKPGDSYTVTAEVETENFSGDIKKKLTLDANVDPYPLELFIIANIK